MPESRAPKPFPMERVMPEGFLPDGRIPEWLAVIRPNYGTIRRNYMIVCLIGAAAVCLLEILMFWVYSSDPEAYGGWKTSIAEYLVLYNVVPSAINLIAVVAGYLAATRCGSETVRNAAPIVSMVVICTVAASAHSLYSVTLSLLCLPIFMASIYGLRTMNYVTFAMCAAGTSIALLFRTMNTYKVGDTALLPEALAAYAMLCVALLLSNVMMHLLTTQKERLLKATIDAYDARQQAQEASEAKSDFLANMSHEIRTPLNAIIGMTEVISRKSAEPETRECASDILQAGSAMLAIIGDIIDITKIEAGTIEIREIDYELGSLINDSYNMVAIRLRDKGLAAEVICDERLPRLLHGDEFHLRQIIVNLLTNAVKYTESGGVTLKVSGEENSDVLKLEVIVKDTGIGIREEDLPALFRKFGRLDDVKDRRIEGVGLGLSITKQLVELMGGTIGVSSVYGVGSTFTVCVPQKIADRTPIGDVHATYLDMHGELSRYRQSFEAPDARILVVDDVASNLQVVRRLLEDTKVSVDAASSGFECIQKVRERSYDLILMDHMMPELDGIATLEAMRALDDSKCPDTPVVMLTANAMSDAREEYMKAGFVDYLAKPVRGARLEHVLLQHIPQSKVHLTVEGSEGGAGSPTDKRAAHEPGSGASLKALCERLPELNADSGLAFCADDEAFYASMLDDFAASGRDAALRECLEASDWENYRIAAHSLKSISRTLGLDTLAEEAQGMEEAAKAGDIDTIREGSSALIAHFCRIAQTIRAS